MKVRLTKLIVPLLVFAFVNPRALAQIEGSPHDLSAVAGKNI